jgi:PilZ domain
MPELTDRERRRAPRREVELPLMLVVDSEASEVSGGAFAVDLSQLGARIRAQVRLEPGQLITVIASGGSGPQVKSRVIWVSDQGRGCDAGVAFLHPVAMEGLSDQEG